MFNLLHLLHTMLVKWKRNWAGNLQERGHLEDLGFAKSRAKCKREGFPCALLCTTSKTRVRWPEVERHALLTSAPDGVSGQLHSLANLHRQKEPQSLLRSESVWSLGKGNRKHVVPSYIP